MYTVNTGDTLATDSLHDIIQLVEEGKIASKDAFELFSKLREDFPGDERDRLRAARIAGILDELDSLVGLHWVKKLVKELQAFIEIRGRREKEGLVTDALVLHMIFRGNPLITPVKSTNCVTDGNFYSRSFESRMSWIFLSMTITLSRMPFKAF